MTPFVVWRQGLFSGALLTAVSGDELISVLDELFSFTQTGRCRDKRIPTPFNRYPRPD